METSTLEPVDGVAVTTLMDNSSDILLPDEGLVRRWGIFGTAGPLAVVPTELAEGGQDPRRAAGRARLLGPDRG